MPVEITVPEVGESISEVFIGEWFKQVGDSVSKDEALFEIETDKATLEVPSPVSGRLSAILASVGEQAQVGSVVASIEEGAAAETPTTASPTNADGLAMPAAERLAAQEGVNLQAVDGSGLGGRILKEDVQRAASAAPQPRAEVPEAPTTPTTPTSSGSLRQENSVPMTPLRRTIARRLVESQATTASLTTFNEVDMSAVMSLRREFKDLFEKTHDTKLGFMSFFVRATIEALKAFPELNARIEGDDIVYNNYYDVGIAVSGKKGLLVPVIRNAERMSLADIEKAIGDFGKRAQNNKIAPEELQGGTFTISNGGVFGSMLSTPILNPPQSGVLGMHNIVDRPVAVDGKVEIRPIMYLALTYDHRIVDGREAVSFLRKIKDSLEKPARLLLEV